MLFLLKSHESERHRYRNAAWAGLFLGLTFLTEYYHFILQCMITVLYFLHQAAVNRAKVLGSVRRLAVVALTALPFVVPVIVMLVGDIRAGITREALPVTNTVFVADLLGFISPSPDNPILGWLSLAGHFTGKQAENVIYVGLVAACLALYGFVKGRREMRSVSFWLLSGAFFGILALGPDIHILGREFKVPMPFVLFDYVPVLKNLRAPSRFYFIVMLSVAVLSAIGASLLFRKRRFLFFIIVPAVLLEYVVVPIHLFDCTPPQAYHEIKRDTEAQAVLEVPFAVHDGFNRLGTPYTFIQAYQRVHTKKIFNGIVSRLGPERIFLSYLNLPVIRDITLMELDLTVRDKTLQTDRRLSPEVVDLFGIDYVVIHKIREEGKLPLSTLKIQYMLNEMLPMRKIYEDDWVAAYRTSRRRKENLVINAGTEQSIPYLMTGWINGQTDGGKTYAWSTGSESLLLLNLEPGRGHDVGFMMRPHEGLREEDAAVTVYLNGEQIKTFALREGWQLYRLAIEEGESRPGLNKVKLRFHGSTRSRGSFGDVWTEGAVTEYLRKMYLPSQRDDEIVILDWEQDNTKFRGSRVAAAVDYITVNPLLPRE
jgi:hypothetical protein